MSTTREATRPTLPARPADSRAERRPFRDNPRLILLGILVLIAALVAMVRFADSSTELNPDFLTEVVLYALSAADLTMLVALVFVLARNIVKLVVERRRGLPFSRFRAKLVLASPRAHDRAVRPRAHRRQRADSQQHGEVVQPADRRRARGGNQDRAGLLPRPREQRRRPRGADRTRDSRGRGRVGRSRRGAPRDRGRGRARPRRAGRGVQVAVEGRTAGRRRAARGRRIIRSAARRACLCRPPRVTRRERRQRVVRPGAARRRRRARARRGGGARRVRPHRRRRAGERLSVGRVRDARPADHRGIPEPEPAARAPSSDQGRVSDPVRHDDADDHGQRDLDRPVSGQAHHASGAAAGGRRPRDWRRPPRSPDRAGDARRVRLARRGVQHHGRGARGESAQARTLAARSRAQEPAARRAAPIHRNRARAHRDRRRLARPGRADRDDQRRGAPSARGRSVGHRRAGRGRLPARRPQAARGPARADAIGQVRRRPCRKSRSFARAASCTSPRPRRSSCETMALPAARSSSSTT